MSKGILVTDFDGVLCDTIGECMFSSYNAYQRINKSYLAEELSDIDLPKRKEFRRLRPYIRSGEDYLLLFYAINNEIDLSCQSDFDELREKHKSKLNEYKKALYAERDILINDKKEFWLSLNPLFEAGSHLKGISIFDNLFILSTKKKEYVIEILKHHKIPFPEQNIIYTPASEKIKNLSTLIGSNKAEITKSAFVEDQVEFLVNSKNLGINIFLVNWSYSDEKQKESAANNHIPIIDSNKFKEILESFVN